MMGVLDTWSDDPEWDAERYHSTKREDDLAYIMATGQIPERNEWEVWDD